MHRAGQSPDSIIPAVDLRLLCPPGGGKASASARVHAANAENIGLTERKIRGIGRASPHYGGEKGVVHVVQEYWPCPSPSISALTTLLPVSPQARRSAEEICAFSSSFPCGDFPPLCRAFCRKPCLASCSTDGGRLSVSFLFSRRRAAFLLRFPPLFRKAALFRAACLLREAFRFFVGVCGAFCL